jgi:cytidine deaminase
MMPAALQPLRAAAKAASEKAYAPYSQFPVGAALSLAGSDQTGPDILGCNVENVSFSMTVCAERNALAHAIARGIAPRTLTTLGIYMPGNKLYSPCGGCRQFIAEIMATDARVYAFCDSDDYREWTLSGLLPDGFDF